MAGQHTHNLTEPLWKRQPHESLNAYTRFCRYRDMPPALRSLQRVATLTRVSDRAVEKLATQHHWERRARAFDAHQRATTVEQVAAARLAAALDLTHLLRANVATLTHQHTPLTPSELASVADAITTLHPTRHDDHHDGRAEP